MTERRAGFQSDDASCPPTKGKDAVGTAIFPRADQPPVDVRALLKGAREATLMLDGEAYKLRITAKEKLILTK